MTTFFILLYDVLYFLFLFEVHLCFVVFRDPVSHHSVSRVWWWLSGYRDNWLYEQNSCVYEAIRRLWWTSELREKPDRSCVSSLDVDRLDSSHVQDWSRGDAECSCCEEPNIVWLSSDERKCFRFARSTLNSSSD